MKIAKSICGKSFSCQYHLGNIVINFNRLLSMELLKPNELQSHLSNSIFAGQKKLNRKLTCYLHLYQHAPKYITRSNFGRTIFMFMTMEQVMLVCFSGTRAKYQEVVKKFHLIFVEDKIKPLESHDLALYCEQDTHRNSRPQIPASWSVIQPLRQGFCYN
ncbi:hypothetical protein PR048_026593 [Dryococelus australis]|uniref:Uncharacterized protein n=1 Tax=Dryococelus australis TaxID=614101 RepID=A0ABQ9GLU1_9NEOP|nr:hypothetical protein PR048_026593 [Dryococelus australis]